MSPFCRSKTNDGEACDCEEYDPPQDPLAPSKCNECGHGKSKHAGVQQAKSKKSTVLDIFAAQSQKNIQDLFPATARVTDFGTARMDALKGFRVAPEKSGSEAPTKKTRKRARVSDSKPAPKETIVSKVILLTCGVKRNELRSSSKAPSLVDLEHKSLHGCVATDVKIVHDWTYNESTECFTALFPEAFDYAKDNARNADAGLWMIVAKEYQTLRIVPKSQPTGADLGGFKTGKSSDSLYIALTRPIPDNVYASWNQSGTALDPSSEIDSESNYELRSDDSRGSSDYIANDQDGDVHVPGRYRTRPAPTPSTRKLESMAADDSEDSDVSNAGVPVKKQRLDSGASRTTQRAGESKGASTSRHSESSHNSAFGSAQSPYQGVPIPRVASVHSTKTRLDAKCTCRKVSPPPAFIKRKLSSPPWEDDDMSISPSLCINPWKSTYIPPAY